MKEEKKSSRSEALAFTESIRIHIHILLSSLSLLFGKWEIKCIYTHTITHDSNQNPQVCLYIVFFLLNRVYMWQEYTHIYDQLCSVVFNNFYSLFRFRTQTYFTVNIFMVEYTYNIYLQKHSKQPHIYILFFSCKMKLTQFNSSYFYFSEVYVRDRNFLCIISHRIVYNSWFECSFPLIFPIIIVITCT